MRANDAVSSIIKAAETHRNITDFGLSKTLSFMYRGYVCATVHRVQEPSIISGSDELEVMSPYCLDLAMQL